MKKTLVMVVMIWLFTVFAFAGVEWVASTKIVGKGKKQNNEIDTRTFAQGGDVKQVFEGVSRENQLYSQDGYWLYKGKEDSVFIVNDRKKNYMKMELDSVLQAAGFLGKLVKIQILEHSIDVQYTGTEKILGFLCNRFKVVSDYKMKIKIAFIKKTMKIHEEKEMWGTTDIPGISDMSQVFMKKDIKTGIEDLDNMIADQMNKLKKIGFPMKVVTHTTEMNKKGKVKRKYFTTMEVTEIKQKKFPSTLFEIPASYDEITFPGSKKMKLF